MKRIKLAISFICYGDLTAKYLPSFLPSLFLAAEKTGLDILWLAWDNLPKEKANKNFIVKNFPEIEIKQSETNLGFGRAYNQLIAWAENLGADYFLVTNPDTFFGEESLVKMLAALELDNKLGSVAPKVFQWDFAKNKGTEIIDTLGIVKKPGLRFADLGQGLADNNALDNVDIIGPSGAAGLFRMKALASIKKDKQYYDELMFMYKEDCDLALHLQLAGWHSELVPDAHVWHDRTVAGRGNNLLAFWQAFTKQSAQNKIWSFHNQLILYYKYWRFEKIGSLFTMMFYLKLRLLYAFLFDKKLWREAKEVWKNRKEIKLF